MRTKLYYEVRLDKLQKKDPVANRGIINKLKRKIRQLEAIESKF